jgi:hypothetical protein
MLIKSTVQFSSNNWQEYPVSTFSNGYIYAMHDTTVNEIAIVSQTIKAKKRIHCGTCGIFISTIKFLRKS